MRVVLILHTNNPGGGVSSVFRSVVPRLVASGVDAFAIVRDDWHGDGAMYDWLQELGVEGTLLEYRWWCIDPAVLKRRPWLGLRARQINARADQRIAEVLESWNADVLVVFDGVIGVGYDAARRAGVPAIGYLQEVPTVGHGMRFFSEKEVRRKLGSASGCVAISSYVRDEWARWVDPGRVTVVPNAVLPDHVWTGERTYAPDGVVRVTLAGTVVPTKGQMLLVEAIERLAEAGEEGLRVSLYGARPNDPSDYETAVRERILAGRAAGRVELLPYETNIARVWGCTDVVVSASAAEGFGLALAEGMASGCLALGPDCGAVPELLGDGRGLIYESGDARSLADALARAAEIVRSGDTDVIGAGRDYARDLTPERHLDALLCAIRVSKG